MQQRAEIYDTPQLAKKGADKLAKGGWFVHAITGTEHLGVMRPVHYVTVVYRKED